MRFVQQKFRNIFTITDVKPELTEERNLIRALERVAHLTAADRTTDLRFSLYLIKFGLQLHFSDSLGTKCDNFRQVSNQFENLNCNKICV